MKKKRFRKRSKTPTEKNPPKIASVPASATSVQVVSSVPGSSIMPDPVALFRQAEEEPDIQTLSAYLDSIQMLREKGFSYREIAEWLSDRGVEVDHNAVYRVYTNSLSDHEAYLEDLREAEEAQQEARRNS
jgi:hypothetical protein